MTTSVNKIVFLGKLIPQFSVPALGAEIPAHPKAASLEKIKFITRMVLSELQEVHVASLPPEQRTAVGLHDFMIECLNEVDIPKKMNQTFTEEEVIEEQFDGLADSIYYMYDFSARHGVNLDSLLATIHQANMNKMWPDGKFHKREDGKVIKPIGWKEPDIKGVLKQRQFDF